MVMSILTSIPMQTELAIHMRIPMTDQKVMTIHIMRDRIAVQTAAAVREGTARMRQ